MAVSCDECGMPTEAPTLRARDGESFYICEECAKVCVQCDGSGLVSGAKCVRCDGSGLRPTIATPDNDEEGYWGW